MKKNATPCIKYFVTAVIMLLSFHLQAQKTLETVSKQTTDKIMAIVKPLRDAADKLFRDDATGTYKAYQSDVEALNKMKPGAEKSKATSQVMEKYAAFFKNVWSNMKVDEKAYQAQIRAAFPAAMAEKITFQQYLNFSYNSSSNSNPAPPPAPAPSPENKCIDVCSIAAGEITGDGKLIASGAGSYGNCYLKVNSWGAVVGGNSLYGSLKNNISIPGTLPADSRKLRVRKSFDLKQEAVAFALGFGFSETRVSTYQSNEYIFVMAPVLFAANKTVTKSISEEYVIEKADVSRSIIKGSANTMVYLLAGSWCYSDCTNIRWSICEEK
ncbi:hypothetical protein [Ferruginibacter sp.]